MIPGNTVSKNVSDTHSESQIYLKLQVEILLSSIIESNYVPATEHDKFTSSRRSKWIFNPNNPLKNNATYHLRQSQAETYRVNKPSNAFSKTLVAVLYR